MSSFAVSPDNVLIYHSCDGGIVDRCMGSGIESLTEWTGWVENTIIAAFCKAKESPCTLMQPVKDATTGVVSMQSVAVGKVIADCLGMTAAKPHVIYDPVTKTAIAGKIELGEISCVQFNKFAMDCPILAEAGSVPTRLMGYDTLPFKDAKWYSFRSTTPLKFVANFSNGDSYNKRTNLSADERVTPRRTIEKYHIYEGDSFDGANTVLTIGTDGLYQIDYSMMTNVEYLALAGWVIAVMTGILVEPASGAASYEIRTDERPMYLNYQTAAGQDIILQCNVALPLKTGDKITPRLWFNNTYIPGGVARQVQMWINRSAECLFSVYRVADGEMQVGG